MSYEVKCTSESNARVCAHEAGEPISKSIVGIIPKQVKAPASKKPSRRKEYTVHEAAEAADKLFKGWDSKEKR